MIEQRSEVDISQFLDLASQDNWEEFDRLAIGLSENPDYLSWTSIGLIHPNINARDLAITLLEHTSSPIFGEQVDALNRIRDSDENLHLRRKAAIALFRHGEKSPKTLDVLHEAYENDAELKDQVKELLVINV